MKSLADALPPEIADQIHPAWRATETGYWAVRGELLEQHRGQWVGFADGAVVASGTVPIQVFHDAEMTGRQPFVTYVGREHEPVRMRSPRLRPVTDGEFERLRRNDRVTTNPQQCGGIPCVRGMRTRVSDVLDLLAAGLSALQVIEELPDLELADVTACLSFAVGERIAELRSGGATA